MKSDMTGDLRAMFSTLFLAIGRKFPLLSTRRGISTLVLGVIVVIAIVFGAVIVYVILVSGPTGITTIRSTYP
jgi:hypothetical protein